MYAFPLAAAAVVVAVVVVTLLANTLIEAWGAVAAATAAVA